MLKRKTIPPAIRMQRFGTPAGFRIRVAAYFGSIANLRSPAG